jgi:hypothetical protein
MAKSKKAGSSLSEAGRTLGSKGGKKGGPARAAALSSSKRSAIAKMGGKAKSRKQT